MDEIQQWMAIVTSGLGALQRDTARALSLYLRRADNLDAEAVLAAAFAFSLGMLHAVIPGHGKIVVFSYFFGRDARPWLGVAVSLKIAATHIGTAILLFAVADMTQTIFFGRAAGPALAIQAASYLMVAAVGGVLLYRGIRGRSGEPPDIMPSRALPFAVGMLPCPLTLLILSYALANTSLAAGLFLVAIMGLGVAVTISLVSLLGIFARNTALFFVDSRRVAGGVRILEMVSSAAIVAVGLLLFAATIR